MTKKRKAVSKAIKRQDLKIRVHERDRIALDRVLASIALHSSINQLNMALDGCHRLKLQVTISRETTIPGWPPVYVGTIVELK